MWRKGAGKGWKKVTRLERPHVKGARGGHPSPRSRCGGGRASGKGLRVRVWALGLEAAVSGTLGTFMGKS